MVALASPEATNQFACDLAKRLEVGDVLLLGGPIGAGKTHFARALIQSLLQVPEDVPSPTFTLVQTYQVGLFELWHADLYRLSSPKEVIELGMLEAFEGAITLVEWPDRLGDLKPDTALHIDFGQGPAPDSRTATLHWKGGMWPDRLKNLANAPA